MRLQTVLSKRGIASRRKAALLIESGRVSVNGKVIREKGKSVDPENDIVKVDGNTVKREEFRYLLFNKPAGIITTSDDEKGRKTVLDFFAVKERIYPVGRLDKNSRGLLLLTNDGELAFRLSHPRFEIEKTYEVAVKGVPDDREIQRLKDGIILEGTRYAVDRIQSKKSGHRGAESVFTVSLHEGKKREIRNMFSYIGHEVLSLKRVGYAGIKLGGLKEGEWRRLDKTEVRRLKLMCGIEGG